MQKTDQQLTELHEKKVLKEKLEIHKTGLSEKLKERKKEQANLQLQLHKSERKIEDLENLSIRNIFLKVLGNKEEQLERARQNYLMCYLKYNNCKERITAKEYELQLIRKKLIPLSGIDKEFEGLLKRKAQYLKVKNRDLAKEIVRIENSARTCRYKRKEIAEAVESAEKAVEQLGKLMKALKHIKSWELAERTHYMHEDKIYVKSLLSEVQQADMALDDLMDELHDVSEHYAMDYKPFVKRMADFLEYFYDGLISDWILHKKLTVSINLVVETIDKIKRIMAMLLNDNEDANEEEQLAEKLLEELLLEHKINWNDL